MTGPCPGEIVLEARLGIESVDEVLPENGRDIDARFMRSNFLTSELTELPEGLGLIGLKEAMIFCWSDIGIRKEAA